MKHIRKQIRHCRLRLASLEQTVRLKGHVYHGEKYNEEVEEHNIEIAKLRVKLSNHIAVRDGKPIKYTKAVKPILRSIHDIKKK